MTRHLAERAAAGLDFMVEQVCGVIKGAASLDDMLRILERFEVVSVNVVEIDL